MSIKSKKGYLRLGEVRYENYQITKIIVCSFHFPFFIYFAFFIGTKVLLSLGYALCGGREGGGGAVNMTPLVMLNLPVCCGKRKTLAKFGEKMQNFSIIIPYKAIYHTHINITSSLPFCIAQLTFLDIYIYTIHIHNINTNHIQTNIQTTIIPY